MAPAMVSGAPLTIDISAIPNNAHPSWWRDPGLRRLAPALLMGYCATVNSGYDGSLVGGLFALPRFLASLGTVDANKIGLVGASYLLGLVGAYPFAPIFADRFGRRVPILIGAILLVASAFLQTFLPGANAFIGGRVMMGFGAGLQSISGTTYVTEMAHPRFRAKATALATTAYFVGSIIAAWFTFGTLNINSDWSYKIPILVQAVPCSFQLILLVLFCPESPRWLIAKGKLQQAKAVLAKFHANGNESDELVDYEFHEIKTAIEAEQAATAGVSYLSFFKTPGNRKRLYILVLLGFYSQWVGNGVISYYLPQILATIGITTPAAQTGVNGGLAIWSWFSAIFGAMMSERLGRRTLWLLSSCGCLLSYVCITICSALFAKGAAPSAGKATIAFIYLFNGFYAIGFTAMGNGLYPLEILPFGLRTKGFALTGFVAAGAAFFNIYVNPLALAALAWKYYFVFIAVLVSCILNIYFVYPETARRTLEEIQELFDGPGAVTALAEAEFDARPPGALPVTGKGSSDEQIEHEKA